MGIVDLLWTIHSSVRDRIVQNALTITDFLYMSLLAWDRFPCGLDLWPDCKSKIVACSFV